MNVYSVDNGLEEIAPEKLTGENDGIVIATAAEGETALEISGMRYDGEINLREITVCKIESQQYCMAGTLCVPKQVDIAKSRYKIQFFINAGYIVFIDDEGFAKRIVAHIRQRKTSVILTKEDFLSRFFLEFISRDMELIGVYNKKLMDLDEKVSEGNASAFQNSVMPIRRDLLILRSYYDELMDLAAQLEENENEFFSNNQLKFFGTVSDRADRLMGKTAQLLEYSQQIRDAYQFQVDSERNKNMQLLTVISTVFYPLTLITGWFGMNFIDMPGLKNGYPVVVVLSIVVVAGVLIWFKKKKII